MKITMTCLAATLAAVAGACTTENHGYSPYYGPSQGYAYPQGYYATRPYYAPPPSGYRSPYGYPYAGASSGPSITFTIPQGM
jgi:hypothetical protein